MRSWPHVGIHCHVVVDRVERRLRATAVSASACPARPPSVALAPVVAPLSRPVHADEPLRRRQEDDRIVAAPAVRILVRERLAVPQPAALLERLLDLRVGVEDALAAEELDGVEKMPGRPDRRVDLEAVLHAGVEVVGAMSRRRVHRARARVERHVVAEHAERVARRRADAGSGCARARRPSSARPARRRRGRPPAPPLGASASATITARPSTSYAA